MTSAASIVLFVGQGIEVAGQPSGPFPPELESALAAAIRKRLLEMQVMIGYSSARAGADILFGEALRALGGEVNLILPCCRDDFVRQYVAPAGETWVERFDALCAAAASVVIACEEKLLGDRLLLRFNNQMLQGMARLRGDAIGLPPHLLLTWSPGLPLEPGGPAEAMDSWPEVSRLALLDLDELRESVGLPAITLPNLDAFDLDAFDISPRAIRALLFGDMESYTKISDEEVPMLFDFLAEAQEQVTQAATPPLLMETWGDSVFAVAESAHTLADWAMALTRAVATLDYRVFGLRRRPKFRMALHIGPVFVGTQPLTGRGTVFGHHVSRAARMEPVATPGAVCASAHFVAALQAEMDERADTAQQTGETYSPRYRAVYLGEKALPKAFGRQDLYRLIDADTPSRPTAADDGAGLGRLAAPPRMALSLAGESLAGESLAGESSVVETLSARLEAFCAVQRLPRSTAQALRTAFNDLIPEATALGREGAPAARLDLAVERSDNNTIRLELSDEDGMLDLLKVPDSSRAGPAAGPAAGPGSAGLQPLVDEMHCERRQGHSRVILIKRLQPDATDIS